MKKILFLLSSIYLATPCISMEKDKEDIFEKLDHSFGENRSSHKAEAQNLTKENSSVDLFDNPIFLDWSNRIYCNDMIDWNDKNDNWFNQVFGENSLTPTQTPETYFSELERNQSLQPQSRTTPRQENFSPFPFLMDELNKEKTKRELPIQKKKERGTPRTLNPETEKVLHACLQYFQQKTNARNQSKSKIADAVYQIIQNEEITLKTVRNKLFYVLYDHEKEIRTKKVPPNNEEAQSILALHRNGASFYAIREETNFAYKVILDTLVDYIEPE